MNTGPAAVEALFEPYELQHLQLPNRLVMAPMTRGFAKQGVPSAQAASYYARRAASGVGLILTEGVAPNPIGSPETTIPNMFGAEALESWAGVVEAVHAGGGKIMPQLWHTGLRRKVAKSFDPTQLSVGPSAEYPELHDHRRGDPARMMRGREMTQEDIADTIASYAEAAANAQRLGFDGVELHAAHGYFFDQFFWRECNQRTDRYGGDVRNRVRIAVEVIEAIKRRTGSDFPVGLRFSQWKLPDFYDVTMIANESELAEFLEPFVTAGVDFLHASTRRCWEPAFAGSSLTLAGWTKKITGKTTIAVGSVGLSSPIAASEIGTRAPLENNLEQVCNLLARGECDLVAVGRAVLADPDWTAKVRGGRFSQIIPYSAESLQQLQ
jgi:2,4-dienoyl-CoA reductase-like NADH-dependent reductase (Old Yellow Enzyme family)